MQLVQNLAQNTVSIQMEAMPNGLILSLNGKMLAQSFDRNGLVLHFLFVCKSSREHHSHTACANFFFQEQHTARICGQQFGNLSGNFVIGLDLLKEQNANVLALLLQNSFCFDCIKRDTTVGDNNGIQCFCRILGVVGAYAPRHNRGGRIERIFDAFAFISIWITNGGRLA